MPSPLNIEGRVLAHRGASGHAPENTIAAMRRAAELGARWVEVDVKLSQDGALVLLHDDTLERTTNARGPVVNATAATLARLDAGAWFGPAFAGERIPTFAQFADICAELDLRANIEIKACPGRERETGAALAAALRRHWRQETPLVSSFAETASDAFHAAAPDVPRGFLTGAIPPDARLDPLVGRYVAIHAGLNHLKAPDIGRAKRKGFQVLVYTVNDPDQAQALFDAGADAVFSDFPERILALA